MPIDEFHKNKEPGSVPDKLNKNLGNLQKREHHQHSSEHRSKQGRPKKPATKKHRTKTTVEIYLSRHFLKFLAVILFLSGILWLIFKSHFFDYHGANTLIPLPSGIKQGNSDFPEAHVLAALIHLLPGILVLCFAFVTKFLLKGKHWLTMASFIAGTCLLYLAHLIETMYGTIIPGSPAYSSPIIAFSLTILIPIPIMFFAAKVHENWLHYVTISFLYLCDIFLWLYYGSNQYGIFILIVVFTILLFYFSTQPSGSFIHTVNTYSAIGFSLLYFFRILFADNNHGSCWIYIGFASLLFLVSMFIHIQIPYEGFKVVKKYLYYSLGFAIPGFYFLTVWYVLRKYEPVYLQGIFALLLTGASYAFLRLKERINPESSSEPYYFSTLLIAAAIVPLFMQHGMLVIYTAIASLLFTGYAIYRKKQTAALMALVTINLAMLLLIIKIAIYYYPALYANSALLPFQSFLVGLISGVFVTFAAYIIKRNFESIRFSHAKNGFSQSNIRKHISVLFYFSTYITGFWLFQYLFLLTCNVTQAHVISWYIFHISFLLVLQLFILSRNSWLYKPFIWIAAASLFLLPLVNLFFVIPLREHAQANGGGYLTGFYFHFLFIPLLAIAAPVTLINLGKTYPKVKNQLKWSISFLACYFVYLLLAEYDSLAVIINTANTTDAVLAGNRHLPYSIVFFLTSLVLAFVSYIKKIKLFRQVSLGVLLFATLKIFLYDFRTFSSTGQALSFWLVGGFLILYSFIYQRLRKINFSTITHSKRRTHTGQRRRRQVGKEVELEKGEMGNSESSTNQ